MSEPLTKDNYLSLERKLRDRCDYAVLMMIEDLPLADRVTKLKEYVLKVIRSHAVIPAKSAIGYLFTAIADQDLLPVLENDSEQRSEEEISKILSTVIYKRCVAAKGLYGLCPVYDDKNQSVPEGTRSLLLKYIAHGAAELLVSRGTHHMFNFLFLGSEIHDCDDGVVAQAIREVTNKDFPFECLFQLRKIIPKEGRTKRQEKILNVINNAIARHPDFESVASLVNKMSFMFGPAKESAAALLEGSIEEINEFDAAGRALSAAISKTKPEPKKVKLKYLSTYRVEVSVYYWMSDLDEDPEGYSNELVTKKFQDMCTFIYQQMSGSRIGCVDFILAVCEDAKGKVVDSRNRRISR